jgi:hypothetical protein
MFDREIIGFIPDDFFDLYLDAALRRLAEAAPCESACHALVERRRGGYRVLLGIETGHGAFIGESVGPDPKSAYDLAEEQVVRQLELWRKTRWESEAA